MGNLIIIIIIVNKRQSPLYVKIQIPCNLKLLNTEFVQNKIHEQNINYE